MQKYAVILLLYLSTVMLPALNAADQISAAPGTGYSSYIKNDLGEWALYSSFYAAGYIILQHSPFFDKPLIDGETDKSYKKNNTVPEWWLYSWMGGVYGLIVFSPRSDKASDKVTYNNIKGFFESAGYSYFITSITKATAGRKRPGYDNYPESEKEKSGRESFVSGHSSISFVIASYSSLFIYEHIGDNSRSSDIALKSAAITASLGAAVFTAWSRLDDNRHHVSDVIAGSAIGIVSGVAGYMHQNGWFHGNGANEDFSILPIITDDIAYLALIKNF